MPSRYELHHLSSASCEICGLETSLGRNLINCDVDWFWLMRIFFSTGSDARRVTRRRIYIFPPGEFLPIIWLTPPWQCRHCVSLCNRRSVRNWYAAVTEMTFFSRVMPGHRSNTYINPGDVQGSVRCVTIWSHGDRPFTIYPFLTNGFSGRSQ